VESNIEEPIGDEDRALNKEGIKIREKDPTRREVKRTRNQDERVKKKYKKIRTPCRSMMTAPRAATCRR
jgi:hypothetical protein